LGTACIVNAPLSFAVCITNPTTRIVDHTLQCLTRLEPLLQVNHAVNRNRYRALSQLMGSHLTHQDIFQNPPCIQASLDRPLVQSGSMQGCCHLFAGTRMPAHCCILFGKFWSVIMGTRCTSWVQQGRLHLCNAYHSMCLQCNLPYMYFLADAPLSVHPV
jgi:hypothetical protein